MHIWNHDGAYELQGLGELMRLMIAESGRFPHLAESRGAGASDERHPTSGA
jgi:hypothetical protein